MLSTVGNIAVNFCPALHGPQRMNFESLLFVLVPPWRVSCTDIHSILKPKLLLISKFDPKMESSVLLRRRNLPCTPLQTLHVRAITLKLSDAGWCSITVCHRWQLLIQNECFLLYLIDIWPVYMWGRTHSLDRSRCRLSVLQPPSHQEVLFVS